jgi:1,6-anhydro-N-acetylmuramate kinase
MAERFRIDALELIGMKGRVIRHERNGEKLSLGDEKAVERVAGMSRSRVNLRNDAASPHFGREMRARDQVQGGGAPMAPRPVAGPASPPTWLA